MWLWPVDGGQVVTWSLHGRTLCWSTVNGGQVVTWSLHGRALCWSTGNGGQVVTWSLHGRALCWSTVDGLLPLPLVSRLFLCKDHGVVHGVILSVLWLNNGLLFLYVCLRLCVL